MPMMVEVISRYHSLTLKRANRVLASLTQEQHHLKRNSFQVAPSLLLTFASQQAKNRYMNKNFDPAIGEGTRWQKGQPSPNPGGRPRKMLLTDAFRAVLAQPYPGDKLGRT
jgi:hypothetical protein